MRFDYYLPTKIIFGQGRISELLTLCKNERVLIITDKILTKIGVVNKVKEYLVNNEVEVFDEVEPNPSCEMVDKCVGIYREKKIDTVIGLGGGSSMDTAKAVSNLLNNEGSILEYLHDGKKFINQRTKLIAIPTTSGTGSEVTNVGVFTDNANHVKKPMGANSFFVDYAIVDPMLTITMPPGTTASTGLDALCHSLEAFWANSSQPLCDASAMYATDLILKNLRIAYDQPENIEARTNMSLASLIAGVAFSQTRTTLVHAISFPLTNLYGIDHGRACAITLVPVLKYNYPVVKEKIDRMAAYAGFNNVESFAKAITDMMEYMKVPTKLSQYNIKKEDIPQIAEIGLQANIVKFNPRKANFEAVKMLLEEIY